MKAAIVYYSFSGNTQKVGEELRNYLQAKGFETDLFPLQALDESSSFFGQCKRAAFKKRAQIKDINFDFSGYDLVCLGTPVWAFGPAPAINTFLDKCSALNGKDMVVFTTCGSGAGNNRCLNYMAQVLASKGAKTVKRFSIQQSKVNDPVFVESKINEVIQGRL